MGAEKEKERDRERKVKKGKEIRGKEEVSEK